VRSRRGSQPGRQSLPEKAGAQELPMIPNRPSLEETQHERENRTRLEGDNADSLLRDEGFQAAYYATIIGIQDDILTTQPDEREKRENLYFEALALRRLTEKLNQSKNALEVGRNENGRE